VIDLDGILLRYDMLVESFAAGLGNDPVRTDARTPVSVADPV
jgi:hypothetical protein